MHHIFSNQTTFTSPPLSVSQSPPASPFFHNARQRELVRERQRESEEMTKSKSGAASRRGQRRVDAMRLKKSLEFMSLPAYATESQVRARYRELLRANHPDKGGSPDKFREVQECFSFLIERLGSARVSAERERGAARVEDGGRSTAPVPGRKAGRSEETLRAIRQGEEDRQQVLLSSDLKELGDEAYGDGDYERAIEYYNAAAAYSRFDTLVSYAVLLFARARAHFAAGDLEKAAEDARRSIESRPIWGDAYALAGRIHLDQRRWLEARSDLERAIELLTDASARESAGRDLAAACKAIEEEFCVCSLRGHEGEVHRVSFLPTADDFPLQKESLGALLRDRKLAATGGQDGSVRIWSCATGECVHTLEGHDGEVSALEWCPDGSGVLVSASADTTAMIWRLEDQAASWSLLKRVEGHRGGLTDLVFDKYGAVLATMSSDGEACLWDLETGLLLYRLSGHTKALSKGRFHPNGRSFCTASEDCTAKVWDVFGDVVDAGSCVHTLEWGDGLVNDVDYTPDGRFVVMVTRKPASVNPFYRILVFSSVSGRICRWFDGHLATITGLSWNPSESVTPADGVALATASLDGTLKVWQIKAEPTGSGSYALESDEFQGRALKQWERPERCTDVERVHEGALYCLAFSPCGEYICAAGHDHHVRIFDSETLECIQDCCGHTGPVNALAWFADSTAVISASSDKTLRVWNVVANS